MKAQMTPRICYWDSDAKEQLERDAKPEEVAEIEARKSALPTVADYAAAVRSHLDTAARARNYDDIVSACSYAGAPNPFQAEGAAFVAWRGACWAMCYSIMAEVQAGTREQPTIPELLAAIPVFKQ